MKQKRHITFLTDKAKHLCYETQYETCKPVWSSVQISLIYKREACRRILQFSVYGNSLTKQLIHFTCRWLGRQLAYCGTRAQEHTPPGQGKVKALVPGNNPTPMPLERWIAVFSLRSTALLRHFEEHWSPSPIFYVPRGYRKTKVLVMMQRKDNSETTR